MGREDLSCSRYILRQLRPGWLREPSVSEGIGREDLSCPRYILRQLRPGWLREPSVSEGMGREDLSCPRYKVATDIPSTTLTFFGSPGHYSCDYQSDHSLSYRH